MSTDTERFPATVQSVNDPDKRGRIKVLCAGLMGDEEEPLPHWIEPAYAWGWFIIPDVGEQIEIEVNTGSSEDESFQQASIDNLNPQFKGIRYWGGSDLEGDLARPVPGDFTARNYGKRRGFSTPGGHVLLFDDTNGDRQVSLSFNSDSDTRSLMSFDKNGSFIVNTVKGHVLSFDADQDALLLVDPTGNSLTSDEAGIRLTDSEGNLVDLASATGVIQLLAANGITMSTKNANIDAGEIALGGAAATDFAILANVFLTFFANHIHPTGVGPSGPAQVGAGGNPALWTTAISQTVKVAP